MCIRDRFKKETGQNFMDYLTELRISKAKELLCGEELSVQDVAEQVGYRDLKYFSRLFKKLTGVSPVSYTHLDVYKRQETAQQEPGGDAAGETYSFSVGTNTAEDSVNHLLAAKFKELIEDRSDGAVTVTLYENGALGGDAELTESCIAGSVDFIVGMTGSLVNYIPEAALFDLPNVFPDLETAREVLDGPILAELQAAYEAGGLKLFGYCLLYTSRCV